VSDWKVKKSGLAVPEEKPKPPMRRYGPLELKCPKCRDQAAKAFAELWSACELTNWRMSGCEIRTEGQYEAHMAAYEHFSKMLLGPDAPEFEVLT
jgi:hypothetical protein